LFQPIRNKKNIGKIQRKCHKKTGKGLQKAWPYGFLVHAIMHLRENPGMTTSGNSHTSTSVPITSTGTSPDAPSPSAFDVLGQQIYLHDRLVPIRDAKISVLDRGLLRGEGVFETLRTYNRIPFAITRHLDRMEMSAKASGIPLPPRAHISEGIRVICETAEFPETRVHVTVTAGPGGPAPDPIGNPAPTFIVIAGSLSPALPEATGRTGEKRGLRAVTLPWVRHENAALTGVKPTSYLDHLIGHKWAQQQEADEGIWTNSTKDVTEATGSNLFIVHNGTIFTPPIEAGLLPGVTRNLILERCIARGIPTLERRLRLSDVFEATECFLTSSTKEATPVMELNRQKIGDGTHPVTDAILEDWRSWAPAHLDP